jgi:hypothetical protein
MAGLRGLDKLGGGTGQVGTSSQIAAYNAKQAAKNKTPAYNVQIIRGAGNPHENMLVVLGSDHYTIDTATGRWVDEQDTPLSAKLQDICYDAALKSAPKNIELLAGKQAWDVTKTSPPTTSTPTTPTSVPTGGLTGTGVTVIHSSPLVLQYKKQNYMLNPQDQWVNVINGKTVNPALDAFLQAVYAKL